MYIRVVMVVVVVVVVAVCVSINTDVVGVGGTVRMYLGAKVHTGEYQRRIMKDMSSGL